MKTKLMITALVIAALLAGCGAPATTPAPFTEKPAPATVAASPTPTSPTPTETPIPIPTILPAATATAAPVVRKLREWADLRTGKGPVYSQDWSPDGRWLVTADYDQLRVWDMTMRKEAGVLVGHTDFVWGLAWSPDGKVLASASQDGSVRLWDTSTYTGTAVLETGWAFCVAWSPDGQQLAVGNRAGEVQIWDVAAQQKLQTWKTATHASIISIAWSPDGATIAAGALDGGIDLWEVATGRSRVTLKGYTDARCDANGLDWSPDGQRLASAHQDGVVRLWEGQTGRLALEIEAHRGWARGVAWSPDGKLLASTGEDKRICLWNPETGQEYAEEHHNSLPVWSAAWSPDGTHVASGGGGYEQPHVGATIVWTVPDVPPGNAATQVPPKATPWRPELPEETCTPSATRTCRVVFVLPAQYYAESGRRYPDQFRDAGYAVTMASDAPEVVEVCENTVGADQTTKDIPVDLHLAEVQVADYDAVIFIGGLGCQDQWEDVAAQRIAQDAVAQGKVLGAAGCAPTILAHAGVLQGKTAAVCAINPPVKHGQDYCEVLQSQGALCSNEEIVRDGLIVTARQKSRYFVAGVIAMLQEAPGSAAPAAADAGALSFEKSAQVFDDRGTFQAALGDLDGDGNLDAVFANPLTHDSQVWLNDGGAQGGTPGAFTNTGQKLTRYGHGAAVGDLDGDGDLDAAIACHQFREPGKVYLNDGGGVLQEAQGLEDAALSGTELNLLDLNGDGYLDIHIAYYAPTGVPDKVYLNDGHARFSDSGLALDEDVIAWGDLDGDGDVDTFGKSSGVGYGVMLNDGTGQFSAGWRIENAQSTVGGVALADFDGDGDLDALVANGFRDTGSFPSRLFWNDGGAQGGTPGQFTDSGQTLPTTLAAELAAGDLDGDGDIDVVVTNMDLPDEVWLNDGGVQGGTPGHFSDSSLRLGESDHMSTKASLGDLDGDGDLDILIGSLNGMPEIWLNTGVGNSP